MAFATVQMRRDEPCFNFAGGDAFARLHLFYFRFILDGK
jgi:hypothetical protein